LQQNLALVETLPGGNTIINFLRGLIIASMGIYILPIFTYVICFQRYDFICDILLGFFSFIFYSPTYLNILNIYALCRIDDISWGTKGLDTSINSKHNHLKDSWKILKYIHVFKFVFWNIIVGILLLSFGSNYYSRFFITLGIVAILSLTLIIKIICAVFYFIGYRCCKNI
jgi:chitin synthase